MKLITPEQREVLLANGRARRIQPNFDPYPVIKLISPDGACVYLLTEIDPDNYFVSFGLCYLGFGVPELGEFSLNHISGIRGPLGLKIERDPHFVADKPLSAYAVAARLAGRIVT